MKESELIFGIMSTFNKTEFSTSDFKQLINPFGVTESCLRTNLSRMCQKELLKIRHEGKKAFYSFNNKGKSIKSNVALSFKSPDWNEWDKSWWGVLFSLPNVNTFERYYIRKKLLAYRFVSLYHGFWIQPLNPNEKINYHFNNALFNKYCTIIRFKYHNDISKAKIIKLWKLNEINNDMKSKIKTIKTNKDKIKRFSPKQAYIKKMLIGNEIVNTLFKDPLLPEIFLPDGWKGNVLRKIFFHLDNELTKISRPYWEKILK